MELVERIADVRSRLDEVRGLGGVVGLVPTMGYLHDGHASLMARSDADGRFTVTTIFVNPLQFAAGEDLSTYPRDLPRDLELCAAAGVDLVFAPTADEMYPTPIQTTVSVSGVAERWEGESRPTHFAGVATVVAKLFGIAGACTAYFGEKDWQQLQVIARMAADLNLPVDVVGCPTQREPDGLARSSRNVYLTGADRVAATVLYQALQAGHDAMASGVVDAQAVRRVMEDTVAGEPRAELDYAAVVHARSLEPLVQVRGEVRLLIAARVGPTRLIDNLGFLAAP